MKSRSHRLVRVVLAAGFVWMGVEVVAFLAVRLFFREARLMFSPARRMPKTQGVIDAVETYISKEGTVIPHPDLGWVPNPALPEHVGGARSAKPFAKAPQPGRIRIAVFGDSFTYGDEGEAADAWPAQLSALDRVVEALNFGVIYYGVDQAYLRFKDVAPQVKPDVAVIALTQPSMNKALTRFVPFATREVPYPLAKPRFVREGETLKLLPVPFTTPESYRALYSDGTWALGQIENDWFNTQTVFLHPLRRFPTFQFVHAFKERRRRKARPEEARQTTLAILQRFQLDCEVNGIRPLVVCLPLVPNGNARTVAMLEKAAVPFMNVGERLTELKEEAFVKRYFTKEANRIVAEAVYAHLKSEEMLEKRKRKLPR